MFLLIPHAIVSLFYKADFTFHDVSINTAPCVSVTVAFNSFTFHDVSINTGRVSWVVSEM